MAAPVATLTLHSPSSLLPPPAAHLAYPSALQFRWQMKCSSVHGILIFAANLTIQRAGFLPPSLSFILFPPLSLSSSPFRHVVRLQINLMSVILPLSGKFLKFHQKSVAYPVNP